MSSKYSVRQADVGAHADAVTALWARCLHSLTPDAAAGRLRHRYLRNPAGAGALLLLEPAGSPELAGVQCLYTRVFHQGGRRWRVAGLADYVVAESHRSLGPALQLMKQGLAVAARSHDWVYGLANPKSEAVCKRSGLRRFGSVQRWSRVLKSGPSLRRWLPAGLAAAAGWLLDTALYLRDAARLGAAGALRWEAAAQPGPAVDRVWQRRDASLLLSERSQALLQWRFAAEEHGAWTFSIATTTAAAGPTGEVLGYVVWRLREGVAEIADFLCADPLRETALLLRGFAWHLRRRGVQRLWLEFFGAPGVQAQLRDAGFLCRPDRPPLYLADGMGSAPPAEQWYFTAFDRDGD